MVEMEVKTENTTKEWYALYVIPGFERRARDSLFERIDRFEMSELFGDILLPTEKRLEIKQGQKKEVEERIFPGYLFVEMNMQSQTWHLVRDTQWVKGFIGGSQEHPRPLSEDEIGGIRARMDGEGKLLVRNKFIVGEQVRIKEGPFADFNGTVESVNMERERLVVSVMVFGRSTPVELVFDQVEKI